MAKDRKWSPLVYYIFGTLAAIVVIVLGIPKILKLFEPDLKAIANGGSWSAPCCVEKELKGISQVTNPCKRLREVMKVLDPNIMAKLTDVCDLSTEIIGTIENLFPYEADNVGSLRAMYTIEIENNGKKTSNTLILVTEDVKYIEYEKKIKGRRQKWQEFRDHECRIVSMGELEPEARIAAKAWVISPVTRDGCFKIIQESHGDVPLYIKTPE